MTPVVSLALVLKRRLLPALVTFSAVVGGAYAYLQVAKPTYTAQVRLAIDDPGGSVSELGQTLTRLPNNLPAADPIAAQAELVASQRILDHVYQALLDHGEIKEGDPFDGAYQIRESLKVKIVPATNFLDVIYEGGQPELTAKIVNTIANAMVQLSAEEIRREASSVRSFLDEQIPQQQSRLKEVEARETDYRQKFSIVDADTQAASLVTSLAALRDQERILVNQLQAASTQNAMLKTVTGFDQPQVAYVATRVGQDEELRNLRASILAADEKIAEASSRFQSDQPQVLSLTQQRSDLQKLYDQRLSQLIAGGQAPPEGSNGNAGATASGAKASNALSQDLISRYILSRVDAEAITKQLQTVKQSQAEIQADLQSLPARRQKLNEIERERNELSSALDLLQNKLQEARIAEAQLISNVRVVDYAGLPGEASSPKPTAILFLAGVAGIALGTGVVLLLELMDRRLHNVGDVESETDVPVIGVPAPQPVAGVLAGDLGKFLDHADAVEPHRGLLKSLELSSPQQPKVLVFSGTRRGEGKSDVVARLGLVAAMLSRRTLIIDADLQDPRQHGIFGLPQAPGLTHVVGNELSLESAIHWSGFKNLDILSYGGFSQRPSTITESTQMAQLIKAAAQKYDLVIIDTRPIK
ncbi:MAG: polysaccharide biosynthesis tyrosine autokinase [Synechococcales cyanobacterium CRU_2_2]|nr:polysaccharide biosynthesis tyrosine autokinase [Synechococcales cyanobacterium CRU_2_2]